MAVIHTGFTVKKPSILFKAKLNAIRGSTRQYVMSTPSYLLIIQDEVRARIEEETKKLVSAQVHETLAKKAFESTKFPETKYVKGYGKYEFSPKIRPDGWPCLDEKLKNVLKAFKPSSDNIHIIHACVKYSWSGSPEPSWEMQFVDNYGLLHTSNSSFSSPPFHLSKPHDLRCYKYPLSTRCIDMIKSLPQWVASYGAGTSGGGFGMDRPTTQGGNIGEALVSVTHIRELAAHICERNLLIEKADAEKSTLEKSLATATTELAALRAENVALHEKTKETATLRAENEQLRNEILLLNTVVRNTLGLEATRNTP